MLLLWCLEHIGCSVVRHLPLTLRLQLWWVLRAWLSYELLLQHTTEVSPTSL